MHGRLQKERRSFKRKLDVWCRHGKRQSHKGCVWINDLVREKEKGRGSNSPEQLDRLTFSFPSPKKTIEKG